MTDYNLTSPLSLTQTYAQGWLPQRNKKGLFYFESSSRSDLSVFELSSENRRIIKKTEEFKFEVINRDNLLFNGEAKKQVQGWVKELAWDFPSSSIKTVFTDHIFNYFYIWKLKQEIVGYGVIYKDQDISHIAYVFYNPKFARSNLPIRMVLQTVIDSNREGLKYCYLGRFSEDKGFYKRNMPGFEYYDNNCWKKYVG